MRVQVTIRRLTVSGVPVRAREGFVRSLRERLTADIETALAHGAAPEALAQPWAVRRLRASTPVALTPGPGDDARLGRAAAQRFCASLGLSGSERPGPDPAAVGAPDARHGGRED